MSASSKPTSFACVRTEEKVFISKPFFQSLSFKTSYKQNLKLPTEIKLQSQLQMEVITISFLSKLQLEHER